MTIQDKSYVELEYSLTLNSGDIVDSSTPEKPLGFIFGAHQIIPGLETKLQGMASGESAKLVVEPSEAYGERDEELVKELPRQHFPEGMDIQAGMIFQASTPGGPATLRVLEIADDNIKADFNHPMAGEKLTFDVKVLNVREATEEELEALKAPPMPEGGGCSSGGCGGGCAC
jgi:FKBP-type peptidyl-prolyl cis-trans isomerase SlyD